MRIKIILPLLLAILILVSPAAATARVYVAITIAPPALPVYEQPICPGDGYIWTPGYWAWDDDFDDYYWVPGTWVFPPSVGLFWTPGYWGWDGGRFVFYDGYWGPQVGFYGGIDYGFGYFGEGFEGGRWDNGRFFYNRSVTNVNVTVIHNVYNENVRNNVTVNHVSYNGGNGGTNARPTPQDRSAMNGRHIPPVAAQVQHVQAARNDTGLRASENHGKPPVAATPQPGAFNDRRAVSARNAGAPYSPPSRPLRDSGGNAVRGAENNNNHPSMAIHPNQLPPFERPAHPNTGHSKLDQKYQQQQEKLATRQQQDRQQLQQRQDQEHQRMTQQRANDARTQQLEQKHQQQTQQMVQRHSQQTQTLERRQQQPPQKPSKSRE
jgi:hypothetical protein